MTALTEQQEARVAEIASPAHIRRIRACESEVTAQLLLEKYIRAAICDPLLNAAIDVEREKS